MKHGILLVFWVLLPLWVRAEVGVKHNCVTSWVNPDFHQPLTFTEFELHLRAIVANREKIYGNQKYESGLCQENAWALVKWIASTGYDLRHVYILDIYPTIKTGGTFWAPIYRLYAYSTRGLGARSRFKTNLFIPLNNGSYATSYWWHSVVVVHGMVYDFDFSGGPLSIQEYFEKMFLPGEHEWVLGDLDPELARSSKAESVFQGIRVDVSSTNALGGAKPLHRKKKLEEVVQLLANQP